MRCFVAVDLDRCLVRQVKEIQDNMSNLNVDVKFVESENLHFTLKFLDEVSEDEIGVIKRSIEEALKNIDAFKISIEGLCYFGGSTYVRTLWLGVNEGKDEFVKLAKNVNDCIGKHEENTSPHLTIGRVKSGRNRELLLNFINKHKDVKIGEMDVKNVKLKSSTLTGKGPLYSDLAVFGFGGDKE